MTRKYFVHFFTVFIAATLLTTNAFSMLVPILGLSAQDEQNRIDRHVQQLIADLEENPGRFKENRLIDHDERQQSSLMPDNRFRIPNSLGLSPIQAYEPQPDVPEVPQVRGIQKERKEEKRETRPSLT